MPNPLENRNVVMGVTGSIACYKAADLASKLTQEGAQVVVIMTEGATEFLTPLTFRAITHSPVVTSAFDPQSEMSINHVALAERAEVVVVAPATANTMAKIAWGMADDALTATVLATQAPIIVAPAMDGHMYENPATQENIARLRSRGYTIAGPAEGRLASGLVGTGRLLETDELMGHIRMVLGRDGNLANRKIVVSAGGTQEPIDAVRFISNRSSGKMAYAVAEAARDRGAKAVLVAAPTALPDPVGVRVVRVDTALCMHDVLAKECGDADALIMAAAVADWRASEVVARKAKKGNADNRTLELTKNPDIIAGIQGDRLVKVGFAAESEDLVPSARAKLKDKGLDLIVANDITAEGGAFGADSNKVVIVDGNDGVEDVPLMSKYEVGHRILDRVVKLLR